MDSREGELLSRPRQTVTGMDFTAWGKCCRHGEAPEGCRGSWGSCSVLRIWEEAARFAALIFAAAAVLPPIFLPGEAAAFGAQPRPPHPPNQTEPVTLAFTPSHLPNCFGRSRKLCQVSEKHKVCDSKNRPACDLAVSAKGRKVGLLSFLEYLYLPPE